MLQRLMGLKKGPICFGTRAMKVWFCSFNRWFFLKKSQILWKTTFLTVFQYLLKRALNPSEPGAFVDPRLVRARKISFFWRDGTKRFIFFWRNRVIKKMKHIIRNGGGGRGKVSFEMIYKTTANSRPIRDPTPRGDFDALISLILLFEHNRPGSYHFSWWILFGLTIKPFVIGRLLVALKAAFPLLNIFLSRCRCWVGFRVCTKSKKNWNKFGCVLYYVVVAFLNITPCCNLKSFLFLNLAVYHFSIVTFGGFHFAESKAQFTVSCLKLAILLVSCCRTR